MAFLNFETNSIAINLVVFGVAAVIIWIAGTRIAFQADVLTDRTGLGKAFMGLLVLATATESPEVGTTISASLANNPQLALNGIFGGIVLQTVILAIVDIALVRGALTFFIPKSVLLVQGVLLVLLLALALAAASAGEFIAVWQVGLWAVALFIAYITALYLSNKYEQNQTWAAENAPSEEEQNAVITAPAGESVEDRLKDRSTKVLVAFFLAGTAAIFVAGFVLARVGEAIAVQTGLGNSFVGATLIAASTSLPELSTTISAVRVGNYQMAISSIFGSNSIMVLLLFVADLFYRQGPILSEVGASSLFACAMGIVVTAVYLVGLLERKNRTILRVGYDSAIVLVLYGITLLVLYQLR